MITKFFTPLKDATSGKMDDDNSQSSKQARIKVDLSTLPGDPGKRKRISEYHPNDQDDVRRTYLQRGPCQPFNHKFKQKFIGGELRRFNREWFKKYEYWLEYSTENEAAYCLCCYLFKQEKGKQSGGDCFVVDGWSSWNKRERLDGHGSNKAHLDAWAKCEALKNPATDIRNVIFKHSDQAKLDYKIQLNATIDCVRFLLNQGLAFRGHDESKASNNKGNFLELIQFLVNHNEDVCKVFQSCPRNRLLKAIDIQKDVVCAASIETTLSIITELGDDLFAILVDDSCDVSLKEQMAIVLRYVDMKGCVIERFLALVHVKETNALSLKIAIQSVLSSYGLSFSSVRGQGYDGASNMSGEFNGLKTLIMEDNKYAFYVHCFAHQLQLTLVDVARKHVQIAAFFNKVSDVVNVVGASCKRKDRLRDIQAKKVAEALSIGELTSGSGLNQETSLKRVGDTRWGSHYATLCNLIVMFCSVIDILHEIDEDGLHSEQRGEDYSLLGSLQTFDFAFNLNFMMNILGITSELSQALQRKDQDIINAMKLVEVAKNRLQAMIDGGWDEMLADVSLFCDQLGFKIPDMNNSFKEHGRLRRKASQVTYLHYYKVEIFYSVIDKQLQELNERFAESNTKLLLCVACLSPCDCFSAFDKSKLLDVALFYPDEFSSVEHLALKSQLDNYIVDMKLDVAFSKLKGIRDLSQMMVEKRKNVVYPLVYKLIKLALILPVATATVERVFSAMKIVKNRLRNKMGDEWMNDCLVTYIEKDVFRTIENDKIMQTFQNMKRRRMILLEGCNRSLNILYDNLIFFDSLVSFGCVTTIALMYFKPC